MKKKSLIIGGIIVFVLAIAITVYASMSQPQKLTELNPNGEKLYQAENGEVFTLDENKELGLADWKFINNAGDVIGEKSGTTTTGVAFSITGPGGRSATSSYITKISNRVNQAIYTILVKEASSTADAVFDVQGSNDYDCDTASSTTSIADMVLTGDVNWFSAGDHISNKTHTTSFSNSTSTASLFWSNPMKGVGQEIILNDLNYECLKLNVSASSTVLWAQIKIK